MCVVASRTVTVPIAAQLDSTPLLIAATSYTVVEQTLTWPLASETLSSDPAIKAVSLWGQRSRPICIRARHATSPIYPVLRQCLPARTPSRWLPDDSLRRSLTSDLHGLLGVFLLYAARSASCRGPNVYSKVAKLLGVTSVLGKLSGTLSMVSLTSQVDHARILSFVCHSGPTKGRRMNTTANAPRFRNLMKARQDSRRTAGGAKDRLIGKVPGV
jgi:hypothetical protein